MALETAADARRVAGLLRAEYQRQVALLGTLQPAEWEAPSYCADWKVYQVVSHLGSGPEISRGSLAQAVAGGPEFGDAERRAVWDRFDNLQPGQVYAAYRETNERFLGFLESLSDAQLGSQAPWFAGGTAPLARLLAARLNETTLHYWDLRVMRDPAATLTRENLLDVLDFNLSTLDRNVKAEQAGQLQGATLEFHLEDPPGRIGFGVAEPIGNIRRGPVPNPDLVVTAPTEVFIRLIWNRYRPPAAPGRLVLSRPELLDDLLATFPGR